MPSHWENGVICNCNVLAAGSRDMRKEFLLLMIQLYLGVFFDPMSRRVIHISQAIACHYKQIKITLWKELKDTALTIKMTRLIKIKTKEKCYTSSICSILISAGFKCAIITIFRT